MAPKPALHQWGRKNVLRPKTTWPCTTLAFMVIGKGRICEWDKALSRHQCQLRLFWKTNWYGRSAATQRHRSEKCGCRNLPSTLLLFPPQAYGLMCSIPYMPSGCCKDVCCICFMFLVPNSLIPTFLGLSILSAKTATYWPPSLRIWAGYTRRTLKDYQENDWL